MRGEETPDEPSAVPPGATSDSPSSAGGRWSPQESAAAQIQSLQAEVFGLIAIGLTAIVSECTLATFVATTNPARSFSAVLALGALLVADTAVLVVVLAVMARYDLIYLLIRNSKPWPTPLEAVRQAPLDRRSRLAEGWFAAENALFYGVTGPDPKRTGGVYRADLTMARHVMALLITIGLLATLATFILTRCAPYPWP